MAWCDVTSHIIIFDGTVITFSQVALGGGRSSPRWAWAGSTDGGGRASSGCRTYLPAVTQRGEQRIRCTMKNI